MGRLSSDPTSTVNAFLSSHLALSVPCFPHFFSAGNAAKPEDLLSKLAFCSQAALYISHSRRAKLHRDLQRFAARSKNVTGHFLRSDRVSGNWSFIPSGSGPISPRTSLLGPQTIRQFFFPKPAPNRRGCSKSDTRQLQGGSVNNLLLSCYLLSLGILHMWKPGDIFHVASPLLERLAFESPCLRRGTNAPAGWGLAEPKKQKNRP